MLKSNPLSLDEAREEALIALDYLTGHDAIQAQVQYFSQVDDRSGANNFCDLLMDVNRNVQKMANTKLWVPIHAQSNTEKLVSDFDLNWPRKTLDLDDIDQQFVRKGLKPSSRLPKYSPKVSPEKKSESENQNPIMKDPRLKNMDKNIVERILNEVVSQKADTKWDDIAGLEDVKQAINEIVVYPMQNPELFQGLLAPARGLLLFGPPGTGKTLIGRCIASESGATFFAISASSLTSKWIGEGEKMVRALFAVARCMQPSVVFIDEIDSLLTQRVDGEHDSSRKMKTEFLVQFDGVSTASDDRLLIIGATNRPHELDEAARRRFVKRLYIPLPDDHARHQIIRTMMATGRSALSDADVASIVESTRGYSGADMATLCKEAALCSVRALIRARGGAKNLVPGDLPPIDLVNFDEALKLVKSSVSSSDLKGYEEFNIRYGSSRLMNKINI